MTLAAPPPHSEPATRPKLLGPKGVGLLVALNVVLIGVVVLTLLTTSALYALVAEQASRPTPQAGDVEIAVLPWSSTVQPWENATRVIRVMSTPPSAMMVGHFTFLVLNYEGKTLLRGPPGTSVEANGTTIGVLFEDNDASNSITAGDAMELQVQPRQNRSVVEGGRFGLYDDGGIPRASFTV